jgi:alpha-tubulin suppressor-like RCC1 family protein
MSSTKHRLMISSIHFSFALSIVLSISPRSNAQCINSLSHTNGHTLVVAIDSSLWAWGSNLFGFLGLGNTTNQYEALAIASAQWLSVSAASQSSFAIKKNRTMWAWGTANFGRLGINASSTYLDVPTQVGTDSTWAKVTGGFVHGLAVKTDGTLWAWGRNQYGEVGDGTTITKSTPVLINSDKDWKQVEASNNNSSMSMGIKNNGTLWGWGQGFFGDTSIQYQMPFKTPRQIGKDSNWKKIVIGWEQCMALKTDSTLWTWGAANTQGALGDSGLAYRLWPKQIMAGSKFIDIAAMRTSIAVRADGKVFGCGRNREGQLGLGDTTDRFTFTETGYIGTVKQIQSGACTMILDSNNVLWAAGSNNVGSIGDGTTINRKTFVPVKNDLCIPLSTDVGYEQTSKLSVYPNPAQQTIRLSSAKEGGIYAIVNPLGVVVSKGIISTIVHPIDVSFLPAGIYFLQYNKQLCKFIKD